MLIIILPMNNQPFHTDNAFIALIYILIALFTFIFIAFTFFSSISYKLKTKKQKKNIKQNAKNKYLEIENKYQSSFILYFDQLYTTSCNIEDWDEKGYLIICKDYLLFTSLDLFSKKIKLPFKKTDCYSIENNETNIYENNSSISFIFNETDSYGDNETIDLTLYFYDDDSRAFNKYSLSQANFFTELDKYIKQKKFDIEI
ncbi:hypothetical protein [Anaerofustis stercorihominis]|uniref:Uncharacterized protein n=1 Tax=Anaerofustis stercorihominis TaxID=214853 RepID=A0A3E3DWZ1_9FIRM|nr:hypothetical protein [Anaerofustis stercorihominis]RGD73763.1 hypothetical protein DW687_08250 [Anaerofustis stercorihominis]